MKSNRWVAAIQLFDFKLVHVPAAKSKRRCGGENESKPGHRWRAAEVVRDRAYVDNDDRKPKMTGEGEVSKGLNSCR